MKEALKEEIGVWKENLKAVIYLTVLDISATVAHIYKQGLFNLWSLVGIFSIGVLLIIYGAVWLKISGLIKQLSEVENG